MRKFGKFLWRKLQHRKTILDFQFEPVCAKLAQITVMEATKMKKKFSMTDEVHNNGATVEKCEKMPTS